MRGIWRIMHTSNSLWTSSHRLHFAAFHLLVYTLDLRQQQWNVKVNPFISASQCSKCSDELKLQLSAKITFRIICYNFFLTIFLPALPCSLLELKTLSGLTWSFKVLFQSGQVVHMVPLLTSRFPFHLLSLIGWKPPFLMVRCADFLCAGCKSVSFQPIQNPIVKTQKMEEEFSPQYMSAWHPSGLVSLQPRF